MEKRQKSKGFRIVWISLLLFLLLPVLSGQKTEAATHSGTCGANAKWKYNKSTKTLTISGKGAVTLNRKKKGYLEANIKPRKLVVKQGITSITCYNNNHEFHYNEFQLDRVSLPNSLRSIQGPLFMNCKIASLTIPKKVKQLDAIPFLYANIKEMKVQKKNKHFTVSKEGILFSKNREVLLYYPRNCKMKKYEVPKSVTKIGEMAFYGNDSLENVVFTKKIRTIGNGAFAYCHCLKKTNIQITKVKQIQDYNGKTYGLQRFFGIWYREEKLGPFLDSYDALIPNMCGYYDHDLNIWTYTDNMNYFGTFQGSVLSSFVMPNTVKYMGKQTFCPNYNQHLAPKNYKPQTLKKLVIGKNFMGDINGGKSGSNDREKTLDLHFYGVSKIKGENRYIFQMKTIQVHKQNEKYRVKSHILYSKNMDTIYLAVIMVSPNLTISSRVHYVARGAFYSNFNLESVCFQGTISQIQDSAFESCYKLTKVELPEDAVVERIGRAAFYGCSKMTFTSGKIHYLDHSAFAVAGNVNFDSSELTYIGNRALQGRDIKSLRLDGPLEYIGKEAFRACGSLTEVIIHSTRALFIDDYAFSGCYKMHTAAFTSDVSVTLGDEVLIGCSFSKVTLSRGTVIPDGGFRRQYYGVEGNGIEIIWV